ncbi:MAG: hypothetical protein FJX78_06185 [Armatimonadetes bacterium]|nr:hypothetical protein [Armatimonadota bacterium]
MATDTEARESTTPHIAVLSFETIYEEVLSPSGKRAPSDPQMRAVDWVEYVKKGSNGSTTREKMHRLERSSPAVYQLIRPAYEAWKKGQEEPLNGTPLSAWPGVNRSMAERLRMLHIKTVEDLAATTDADGERVGMGWRGLRENARAFLLAREGEAVVAKAMVEKDRTIETMAQEISELKKAVVALSTDRPTRAKPQDAAKGAAG